jgi:uncharacterized repeat protein (TIGR01451 family)
MTLGRRFPSLTALRTSATLLGVLPAALLASAVFAGSASALACTPASDFPAPPPGAPLPGSCFEAYDGDQKDPDGAAPAPPAAPNRLDWQSVASVAQKAPDFEPGGSDSQFGPGGSEETPDSWTFDIGSLGSNKYDFISAYSYPEPTSADLMFAMAFIRRSNNGTSWLAFELNQKLPGYRTAPESGANPPRTVKVPTRSTGDLLITYSVSNNNSPKPVVGLCKWLGDEHSGKWTNFAGTPVGQNCPALGAAVAQADLNGADIPAAENYLGSPAGALEKGSFGEAMLNLTEAFKGAGGNPNAPDPCLSFGYFWVHSRSSESITSNQQDYILPSDAIQAATCAVAGKKYNDVNHSGTLDAPDQPLGGWTIFADYDGDSVLDPGEPFDVTAPRDANDNRPPGTYLLTNLQNGTYPIREVQQAGWACSSPAPCHHDVTMTGALQGGLDFLNFQQLPAIDLVKTAALDLGGDGKLLAGDKVHYGFTIKNTGNVTLTGVDLDDALVGFADATCAATTLAPTASTTCTADYTLTQADIDAGSVTNNASACGDPPQGAEVCDPATTTTPLAQVKAIDLVKVGTLQLGADNKLNPGDKIHYSFAITNTGNVTLTGVDLTDALVGFSDATCGATTLAPGATTNCTADYAVTQADIDAGSKTNSANACGDPPAGAEVCDTDATTTPLGQDKAIQLVKTAALGLGADSKLNPGDKIHYSFAITNVGNVTLTGVDLTDALVGFADATCGATTLAPGATTNCTADYTLTQADIDAGAKTNTATACGDPPAGAEVCDDDTTTTQLPPDKKIALHKTAVLNAPAAPKAGDTITYTFEITNTGNVTLTGVDLDDALVAFTNATCGATTLAPGAKTTCNVDYTLTQADVDAGSVSNSAHACGDPPAGAEVCGDGTTTTPLPPDKRIELKKTGALQSQGTPKPGDKITYTFLITNTGTVTLSGVDLTDALVGLADAACGAATLAPGASASCTAGYTITQADIDAGSVANTATACGDPPAGAEVCDDDTTTVALPQAGSIDVVKDGPATAFHGDKVTYTFKVTNPGNTTLSAVTVTDDRCAPLVGPAFAAGDNDALLEPGEEWRYTCTRTMPDHAAGEANPVVNTATATGTDPAGAPHSDTDTHSTALLHPAIQIVKAGPASAEAGQRVPYTLTVTNPGDVAIVGETLSVTDPLCDAPPLLAAKLRGDGADPTPDTLDPGDRWVYGCFAPTAAGQGQLVNTAQVTGTPVGTTVDVHGVTDDDSVTTPLTQPKLQVLPQTIVSGAAKLSGPSACVAKKFVARVAGRRIKSVTWFIDGKKVKTFTSRTGEAAKTTFSVDPGRYGKGVHRLQARITFNATSRTPAKTLRMTFQRCARQVVAPQFTG